MAHFRTGTQNEDGTWTYSLQSCFLQFSGEYPDVEVSLETFARHRDRLISRYLETGSVLKRKREKTPTVLAEPVVDDIRMRMEVSPNKSLRKLSAQTGISYGSVHTAMKKLHMHPYKVSVHQHLRVPDIEKRINYCHWFNETLHDEDLDLTFYSDEAWFHLSGYINSQNYRTWSTENPHVFVESSLHPIKVGVWIVMSRRRIIGPLFFYEAINAVRYRELLLEPFVNNLHDDELMLGFFQQDGAPPHTARATIRYLEEFYDDRLISVNRWPGNSPDLTPLDFFLFGYLKNRVFSHRLHNLEELEAAITEEVNNISRETLVSVFNNMKRRVNLCLECEGGHFEHLL